MGVIKVIITILLVGVTLLGGLILSYQIAQDNPFDSNHKHELVLVEASDPTCDTVGYRAHYVCKGCDKTFADEEGFAPLDSESITIKALGHNYINGACAGIKKCETCGFTSGTSNSHVPMAAVKENVVIGNCVTGGSYELVVKCKVCGHEISREKMFTDLSAHVNADGNNNCDVCGKELCKEHKPVTDPAVEATCTQEGYTEGSHCSECNTVLVPQQVIPAAHSIKLTPVGTIVLNADGSFNTENFTLTMSCTACTDVENAEVTDFVISASDPFNKGGTISARDAKFSFPALDFVKYDVASTYDGNDIAPLVVTAFALKDSEFSFGLASNHAIDLLGDGTVYSIYELARLNNENVTVTYDETNGYLYSSKQNHTINYLVAYGADLTVTGDVHVLCAKRINVNTHLIIGTDSVAANVKIERAADTSAENEVITLWRSADLTIKNGTLTTVGKATANWAVDIRIAKESDVNPTSDSLILIEKKGNFVTEGSGEYCIFIEQASKGRLVVDGTITSNRSIVAASEFKMGDEYEYGFEPSFYIRHGTITITDTTMPLCVSSIQVGSEKENASGSLTISTAVDCFRMGRSNVNYVFAKGTLDFNISQTDKTVFQMGGDGTQGHTAYRPYYDSDGYVSGTIDFKKDIVVNAEILSGKDNYLVGVWRSQATYVQNWMIEEGATFNLTNIAFLVRTPSGNNVKVAAYKEAELTIDGTVKTVKVASKLGSTITTANSYSNLAFATIDSTAWTTDSTASVVNGWTVAKDASGNTIYYK